MEIKDKARILLNDFNSRNDVSFWNEMRRKTLELIINDDINRFLRWEPIQYTMNVTRTGYAGIELDEFKNDKKYFDLTQETIVGNPVPSAYLTNSSDNLIHNIYHIQKFEKIMGKEIKDFKSIFEFGGGYGLMAKLLHKTGFNGEYTIFDFPEFSLIQEYYLNNHNVKVVHKNDLNDGQINVDLFIGNWSISETPLDFRDKVLTQVSANYYLIAFQDVFENISNLEYFGLIAEHSKLYTWKIIKIDHLSGNQYYLFGTKND